MPKLDSGHFNASAQTEPPRIVEIQSGYDIAIRNLSWQYPRRDSTHTLKVRIVQGVGYRESDTRRLLSELKARLGDTINIDIEFVSELPMDVSGKLKFVVSSVGRRHRAGGGNAE